MSKTKPVPNAVPEVLIKLPNFLVTIQCVHCSQDFHKRVVRLEDVQSTWAAYDLCESCDPKRAKIRANAKANADVIIALAEGFNRFAAASRKLAPEKV